MPAEHDIETRIAAEELFVEAGYTLAQAAEKIGAHVNTVSRWAAEDGWKEARLQFLEQRRQASQAVHQLRAKMLQKALRTLEPADVYAAAKLNETAVKPSAKTAEPPLPEGLPAITTAAEAIEALQKSVEQRLHRMLAGQVDISGLKDIKTALEMIDKMKAKWVPDADTGKKVLDADQIRQIREQLL